MSHVSDVLTQAERDRLAPYVTDVSGPVFALTNLPEVVKGALFARYSRSTKSLRRLLLDEFLPEDGSAPSASGHDESTAVGRAEGLYDRVLAEYGDDSVAQLGAAHVAVEGASNILTKVLEWGRLASYLEQSTRYIRLDDRPGGRHRYHRPAGVMADPDLSGLYESTLDAAFDAYSALVPRLVEHIDAHVPKDPTAPAAARERAIRASALDALRGLLPAATEANVGIFGSGQAYEALLVRLQASPLAEARECGERMLTELRKVVPAFLTRVDRPDRGVRHARYLAANASATAAIAEQLFGAIPPHADGPVVRLIDFDPDGEDRVLTHALWPESRRPLAEVRGRVETLSQAMRAGVLAAYIGDRSDRRERPGRALEATTYTFEVVCDYGAYRDLQRHRMLSLQAQPLTPDLGYEVPADVLDADARDEYVATQEACADLARAIAERVPQETGYAVTLAHRIRFTMTMNAREAMHVIELRSQPQGHTAYRLVAQEMHTLIRETAGHRAIADAMEFVDHSGAGAGRMAQEIRTANRSG